jgi:hypothetical protein
MMVLGFAGVGFVAYPLEDAAGIIDDGPSDPRVRLVRTNKPPLGGFFHCSNWSGSIVGCRAPF